MVETYALLLASLLLLGGALGDLYGRRKVFVSGVLLFAAGSAWCGFAPSIVSLISPVACKASARHSSRQEVWLSLAHLIWNTNLGNPSGLVWLHGDHGRHRSGSWLAD